MTDVFGVRPVLVGQDAFVLEHYARMRKGTAAESPVDWNAAIELYERVYGRTDPLFLLDAFAALDLEWAKCLPRKGGDDDREAGEDRED